MTSFEEHRIKLCLSPVEIELFSVLPWEVVTYPTSCMVHGLQDLDGSSVLIGSKRDIWEQLYHSLWNEWKAIICSYFWCVCMCACARIHTHTRALSLSLSLIRLYYWDCVFFLTIPSTTNSKAARASWSGISKDNLSFPVMFSSSSGLLLCWNTFPFSPLQLGKFW